MKPLVIAVTVSIALIGAILAGTYWLFFLLAAHFPPGRTLGTISAALMVGSGLACAAAGYLMNKWLRRRTAATGDTD